VPASEKRPLLRGGIRCSQTGSDDLDALCSLVILNVPADEPNAANALRIGDTVVPVIIQDVGVTQTIWFPRVWLMIELIKAEGSVTCMSLLLDKN
jgi:hypothetical protein